MLPSDPRVRILLVGLLVTVGPPAEACTTILVGRGLTADGSVIHAHNEDMGNEAAGRLWWARRATHPPGTTLAVPYVDLPQAATTLGYWASGNASGAVGLDTAAKHRPYDSILVGLNERGVSMSCNWAHSRAPNREGVGIRRYAIRQILLERATSARHGVEILGELIETHGQADWGGLIYHLADSTEAWVVETTTRNWVARQVRDDEIRVTANRFRIGSDYDLSSASLVPDAVENGWLDASAEKLDFARVYGRPEKMSQPYDTRREQRVADLLAERAGALTPEDLFPVLRDRYEGTEHYTPPQPGPVWREDLDRRPEISRTISTNLAQSTFVAQMRSDLPVAVGAVMWLGLATPSYAGYVPLYAGGGEIPSDFSRSAAHTGEDSAWWLFRRLQRAADRDYEQSYPAVRKAWDRVLAAARSEARAVEGRVTTLLEAGESEQAIETLSGFTSRQAEIVLEEVRQLHPEPRAQGASGR